MLLHTAFIYLRHTFLYLSLSLSSPPTPCLHFHRALFSSSSICFPLYIPTLLYPILRFHLSSHPSSICLTPFSPPTPSFPPFYLPFLPASISPPPMTKPGLLCALGSGALNCSQAEGQIKMSWKKERVFTSPDTV